ncbi:hypothetical protein FB451DRAFT_1247588 [Mycena latifolia]|nr:hypothetical protein FB451DRAFT_1247588 [Mycena latifolia]
MAPGASAVRIYALVYSLYVAYVAWPAMTQFFPRTTGVALFTASAMLGYLSADLRSAIVAAKAKNATSEALEEGKVPALPDGQARDVGSKVVDTSPPDVRRKIAVLVLFTTLFAADIWVRATEWPPLTNAGGVMLSGLEVLFVLVALPVMVIKLYRRNPRRSRCAGTPQVADIPPPARWKEITVLVCVGLFAAYFWARVTVSREQTLHLLRWLERLFVMVVVPVGLIKLYPEDFGNSRCVGTPETTPLLAREDNAESVE